MRPSLSRRLTTNSNASSCLDCFSAVVALPDLPTLEPEPDLLPAFLPWTGLGSGRFLAAGFLGGADDEATLIASSSRVPSASSRSSSKKLSASSVGQPQHARTPSVSLSLTDARGFLAAGCLAALTGLGASLSSSSESMTRERFLVSGLRFLGEGTAPSLSLSSTTIGLRLVDDGAAGASSSDVRDESAATAERLSPSDVGGGVSTDGLDLDELARAGAGPDDDVLAVGFDCVVDVRGADEDDDALGALGSARLK